MEIQIDPIPEQNAGKKPSNPKFDKFVDNKPSADNGAPDGNGGRPPRDKGRGVLIGIIAVLLVILLGAGVWFAITLSASREREEMLVQAQAAQQRAELDLAQAQMNMDFDQLNEEFRILENQRSIVMDDSVKRELTEKYEAAKLQVEKLQRQLRDQKNLSAAEIAKLKDEISTLRALLKHYIEEIDRLNKENEALRTENQEIKNENTRLTSQVEQTSKKNEELTTRMTIAEKLNVTGVSLTALNKKGKDEKKVRNAKQLMVTFTIPQNNSTPVGEKTIYLRLLSPSGQLLGGSGKFAFEGAQIECTARKVIEYDGQEVSGIKIYWDVTTALDAGSYTVELFADNYRLIRKSFTLN